MCIHRCLYVHSTCRIRHRLRLSGIGCEPVVSLDVDHLFRGLMTWFFRMQCTSAFHKQHTCCAWLVKSPDRSSNRTHVRHYRTSCTSRDDVHNVNDLERVLHEERRNVPVASVNKLIASTRRRYVIVIEQNVHLYCLTSFSSVYLDAN